MIKLFIIYLTAALILIGPKIYAQTSEKPFHIVGTLAPKFMQSHLSVLEKKNPSLSFKYTQMRESEIVSNISVTSQNSINNIDIAIFQTPDVGVRLANEGLLQTIFNTNRDKSEIHWRGEVLALFFDPAVFIARQSAFGAQKLPNSRIEVLRYLEKNSKKMHSRIGLVNIGVNSQSYTYAANDQLRSPLFWRIMQTFGNLNVQIFETNAEILAALQNAEIDLAFNIPISELAFSEHNELTVIAPKDYVVSMPWVLVAPSQSQNPFLAQIVKTLQVEVAQLRFPNKEFWEIISRSNISEAHRISIGPELLVFLDPIKKTNILDSWFQMVTGQ